MIKVLVLTALLAFVEVKGFGARFNRFNPTMMNNFGYGGFGSRNYAKPLYRASDKAVNENTESVEEAIERKLLEAEEEEDPCFEKRCTANEHCCEGYVCVDTEDNNQDVSFGTCLPIFGKKQGESCFRDNDCESGFLCLANGDTGSKVCQLPASGSQGLGEDCRASSDCNIQKGLCCKLQRRARSQPKKICTYFTDPLMCIGPVAPSQILSSMEYTAGEKRLSGHPDYHHIRRDS